GGLVGAAAAPAADRCAARDAAHRPPAREAHRGPHPVATAWHTTAGTALAGHGVRLERTVAGAGAAAPRHGSRPARRWRERAARRRLGMSDLAAFARRESWQNYKDAPRALGVTRRAQRVQPPPESARVVCCVAAC